MKHKTLSEVVENVKVPSSIRRQYSTSVYKKTILDALGIKANGNSHADFIFEAIGLNVTSERVGRKSIPVVSLVGDTSVGGWTSYGDADFVDVVAPHKTISDLDLSVLSEWMTQ